MGWDTPPACPCLLSQPVPSLQTKFCSEFKAPAFLWLNLLGPCLPRLTMGAPRAVYTFPALGSVFAPRSHCPPWPGCTLLPACDLLLVLRGCFVLCSATAQPRRLAALPARQEDFSLAEPVCATRLCHLAPSRSKQHPAACPAWKREAEEQGFSGEKRAKGLPGTRSCQLATCDTGSSAGKGGWWVTG